MKAKTKWNDTFYVQVYEARRAGISNLDKVAALLHTSGRVLTDWLATKPALRDAWERGGAARGNADRNAEYRDFVYDRLPAKLKAKWDEIDQLQDAPDAYHRIKALFNERGKQAQQHLFLFALVNANFNKSEALKKCGMSKSKLDDWIERDPTFADLVDEVLWHKKEFFESHLVALVKGGDSAATIFANKTFNRDRGYADKTTIEHTGSVQVEHRLAPVGDLNLPIETKRVLLDALRAHLQANGEAPLPGQVHRLPPAQVLESHVVKGGGG